MSPQPQGTPDPKKLLKEILAQELPPPFLLVLSDDRTRRERFLSHLLSHFFPKNGQTSRNASSAIRNISIDELNLSTFAEDIQSDSLFAPQRIFIIRGIHDLPANSVRQLLDLLSAIPTGVSVFLLGNPIPVTSVLRKNAMQRSALAQFSDLKGFELRRWVERELRLAGITTYPEELPQLIATVSSESIDTIVDMTERLALYTNGEVAELDDLHYLFRESIMPNEYELLTLLQKRDLAKAEILSEELLRSGKSLFLLLSVLSRSLSQRVSIRALCDQGVNQASIRQSLSMKPWIFNKEYSAAQSRTMRDLYRDLCGILTADSKLKNRSLGPQAILSELCEKLSTVST